MPCGNLCTTSVSQIEKKRCCVSGIVRKMHRSRRRMSHRAVTRKFSGAVKTIMCGTQRFTPAPRAVDARIVRGERSCQISMTLQASILHWQRSGTAKRTRRSSRSMSASEVIGASGGDAKADIAGVPSSGHARQGADARIARERKSLRVKMILRQNFRHWLRSGIQNEMVRSGRRMCCREVRARSGGFAGMDTTGGRRSLHGRTGKVAAHIVPENWC